MSDPKDPTESKTFCVMPFINLATETNGKCKICCIVMTNKYIHDEKGKEYLIHKDPIEEIWNSDYLKDVRRKMSTGQRVADCFYCYNMEDSGSRSPRLDYNDRWLNLAVKEVERSALSSFYRADLPISMEPRPGITCNLKCVMCWSMSSSKVFSERKMAVKDSNGDVPKFLKDSWQYEVQEAETSDFSWSNAPQYLENLRKTLPRLKRLYVTGGEPTLIRSNVKILEELLALGRKDCMVSFTTNLCSESRELMEVASQFDRVEITGSIDGLAEMNHYIRYPSRWDLIERNLEYILSQKKFYFSIMSVIQILNLYDYPRFLKWLSSNSETKDLQIIPTMIQFPQYLKSNVAPLEMRQNAWQQYEEIRLLKTTNPTNQDRIRQIQQELAVDQASNLQEGDNLRQFLIHNDKMRGTSIAKVFPELAAFLNINLGL